MAHIDPKTDDILQGLGANERALLERVPTRPLRRVAVAVVRTKMKLQFTGWLQYVLPIVPITLLSLIGGVVALLGFGWVASGFAAIAGLLAVVALFDLITVKFRFRPQEARPARNDHLDKFQLMKARCSCRSFQNGVMSDEDRTEVMASVALHTAAATMGPSPVRLEYICERLTVWPTVNGAEFLVAIVPREYDRRSVLDVGRVLQNVVLDATKMGLGTCWIGPGADHESLQAHLGDRFDPDQDQIICTCAVGYPSRFAPLFVRLFNRMFRRRLPRPQLFFSDADLVHPIDENATPYRSFARNFEVCQWAPSSYNGQTTRAVVRTEEDAVVGVDFYASTTSRYYAPVAVGVWCANWEVGCEAHGILGTFEAHPSPDQVEAPRCDVTWTTA